MEIIEWLRTNVAVAQFFAYTSLTVTTAIVAILSLRFSYRQHHGWKPILLLVTRGLKMGTFSDHGDSESDEPRSAGIYAWVSFDLWNRRTYPIVIEDVSVTFSQDILDKKNEGRWSKGDIWVLTGSAYKHHERFSLDNGKHHSFNLHGKMKEGQSLDEIDGEVTVRLRYFDPRRKKSLKMVLKEPYNFRPASSGWREKLLGRLSSF